MQCDSHPKRTLGISPHTHFHWKFSSYMIKIINIICIIT